MKSRPSRSSSKATNSAADDKSLERHSLGPCGSGSGRSEIVAFHIFAAVDRPLWRTGCSTVAVKRGSTALPHLTFYLQNSIFWRADERTRTAFLLITSDHSGVAGGCSGLQNPHF